MPVLARRFGTLLHARRVALGITQVELAGRARVSRAILSRLESGAAKVVQTDVLERLCAAAGVDPQPQDAARAEREARLVARAEHRAHLAERRARHYRIAAQLAAQPAELKAELRAARERVSRWRQRGTCAPLYIRRWEEVLALPPVRMARAMTSFGEWEDALYQNSPWLA